MGEGVTRVRAFVAIALVSCSPTPSPSPSPDAAAPRPSWTLRYGPITIPPGAEPSTCLTVDGPAEPIWFSGYRSDWSQGLHHFGVYAATNSPRSSAPYPCNTPSGEFVLMLQSLHQTAELSAAPEYAGLATRIAAGPMSVNVHSINTTPEPLTLTGEIQFFLTDEPSPELRAGPIKANWPPMTTPLSVPPHSTTTVVTSCTMGSDVSIVRAWGHQHAHGSRFEAFADGARFYTSTSWESPPVAVFDSLTTGDLLLKAGSRLELRCEVGNDTAAALPVGPSEIQTAEMCALMGTWMPSTGGWFPCR